VDDDLINLKVMVNLLKRKGWDTATAPDGRQCLDLVARQHFDLVLMDIQMPELDGYKTAALVREQEARQAAAAAAPSPANPGPSPGGGQRRLPIIALTTVSEPGTRDRCLAAGMDDHLTKPVNTQSLYEIIQRYLGRAG
jgi:CheY-like chemotaxis protein